MSILIVFENKNPIPWKQKLKEKLPNEVIEIYPEVKDISAVDFVVCWKPKKDVLAQFPNIKVIQSVGASIDHIINSQVVDENRILSRIIDNQLSNDMWEHLLGIVMSRIKNIPTYAEQQKSGVWKQQAYQSINETTISILGLGQIGGFVAEKFAKLDFKVKGWSNSKKDILNVESFAGKNELDEFLQKSNFLINLLPLTSETEGILNLNLLQSLPKGTYLINVGRGEHLVESDLIELLENAHLSGASLDVFHEEPLPENHSFWKHPKIKITPHVASLTNVDTAINQVAENYNCYINNIELQNTVSLQKGY